MKKILALLTLFVLSQSTYAGKIYKYIDTDGNIHYSENKPFEDSEVAQIKGVKTIDSENISSKSRWRKSKTKGKNNPAIFENFVITYPGENKVITSIDKNITVEVNIEGKLSSNYRIKFIVDDMPHGRVKSNKQLIGDMELGEHTVYAQVIEARSRKIINTSPTVIFYVK